MDICEARPRLTIQDLRLLVFCLEVVIEFLRKQLGEGKARIRTINYRTKEELFDRQAEKNRKVRIRLQTCVSLRRRFLRILEGATKGRVRYKFKD